MLPVGFINLKMSIKLCLIGDSNVDRHFAKIKAARNEPCFQNVSVVRATNMAQVKAAVCPPELAEAQSHVLLACVKRKSGDLFSGTSKQRVLSQDMPDSLL